MTEILPPVYPGIATLVMARVEAPRIMMRDELGLSPSGIKDLVEGRSAFSPFKVALIAQASGIPEEKILAASRIATAGIGEFPFRPGETVMHPFLGRSRIVSIDQAAVTIRTDDGRMVEGVSPMCLLDPEHLSRLGIDLSPYDAVNEDGSRSAPFAAGEGAAAPAQPAADPASRREEVPASGDTDRPEPGGEEFIPAKKVQDLVCRSGKSLSRISRDMGEHKAYISGILTRGRKMPAAKMPALLRACAGEAAAATAGGPGAVSTGPLVAGGPERADRRKGSPRRTPAPIDERLAEGASREARLMGMRQQIRLLVEEVGRLNDRVRLLSQSMEDIRAG